MTYDKQTILNCIPFGKNNSISRAKLRELTGYTDRHIRRCIAEMVTDGDAPIISTSTGSGYYLAQTDTDYLDAIVELNSKTDALRRRAASLTNMRIQSFYAAF